MENMLEKKDIENLVIKKQNELIYMMLEKENEIEQLKKQEQEIKNKRTYKEKALEEFKDNLKNIFEENGIEKIQTETGTISLRQNPISVVINDIEKIPEEYKSVKITITADKKSIAEHFKETGEILEGVTIETDNKSIQVK